MDLCSTGDGVALEYPTHFAAKQSWNVEEPPLSAMQERIQMHKDRLAMSGSPEVGHCLLQRLIPG